MQRLTGLCSASEELQEAYAKTSVVGIMRTNSPEPSSSSPATSWDSAAPRAKNMMPPHPACLSSRLACSLRGGLRMTVRIQPRTLAHRLYGCDQGEERYYCNFGF